MTAHANAAQGHGSDFFHEPPGEVQRQPLDVTLAVDQLRAIVVSE